MKIYRYEKEDGGGPFFSLDGISRIDNKLISNYDMKFGCTSIEQLLKWFQNCSILTTGCQIKIYEIPEEEVIFLTDEVSFPKKYKPIN